MVAQWRTFHLRKSLLLVKQVNDVFQRDDFPRWGQSIRCRILPIPAYTERRMHACLKLKCVDTTVFTTFTPRTPRRHRRIATPYNVGDDAHISHHATAQHAAHTFESVWRFVVPWNLQPVHVRASRDSGRVPAYSWSRCEAWPGTRPFPSVHAYVRVSVRYMASLNYPNGQHRSVLARTKHRTRTISISPFFCLSISTSHHDTGAGVSFSRLYVRIAMSYLASASSSS